MTLERIVKHPIKLIKFNEGKDGALIEFMGRKLWLDICDCEDGIEVEWNSYIFSSYTDTDVIEQFLQELCPLDLVQELIEEALETSQVA